MVSKVRKVRFQGILKNMFKVLITVLQEKTDFKLEIEVMFPELQCPSSCTPSCPWDGLFNVLPQLKLVTQTNLFLMEFQVKVGKYF